LTLAAVALAGLAASSLLCLVGREAGSGVAAPRLWFFGPNAHLLVASRGLTGVVLIADAALVVLAAAWLILGWLVWRRRAGILTIVGIAALWSLPLLVGPPLFSPDIYEYVAFGSLVHHGVDPYRYGPSVLHLPVARGTDPFWARLPSPYGPGFLAMAGAVATVVRDRLLAGVIVLRAVAVASLVAFGFAVRRLAQIQDTPVPKALWLVVANPVVLLVAVSSGHNDVLMMALVAWGLVAALSGRPLLAVVLIAMAATFKVIVVVLVAVVVVERFWQGQGLRDKLRNALPPAVVGTVAFVAMVEALGFGWGWWHLLWLPTVASDLHTPVVAVAVAGTLHAPGLTARLVRAAGTPTAIALCRKVGEGLIVVATLLALGYQRRLGMMRTAGLVLVALVVFGPVLWPWYLLWPIAVLAPGHRDADRWLLAAGSVVLLFVSQPGGVPVWLLVPVADADNVALGCTAAFALAVAAVWFRARRRRRAPAVDDLVTATT
jgi:hypothetical protein